MDEYESLSSIRKRHEDQRLSMGRLEFIVGMQYGSEAKGSIAHYLGALASVAVRTGAANAGHTLYYNDEPHVMRQLPSAWTNPETKLVIGAGALISPDVLMREISTLEAYVPIKNRLMIDERAHIITGEQILDEAKHDLGERIGSTSSRSREGIGVAMADKVLRLARTVQVKDFSPLKEFATDTIETINTALDAGQEVLVEGTQGYGLSIDYGDYPYVTSRNAAVSSLADSIGVNPAHYRTDVIGVTRTFPIRVAGNSGPFATGSEELTWEQVRKFTRNSNLPTEITSVTRLPRRIATFSDKQYIDATRVNRPTEIAVTFADYIDQGVFESEDLSESVLKFIEHLEDLTDVPVTLVKTGPQTVIDFDRYRRSVLRRA